jgi:hypothetical protein
MNKLLFSMTIVKWNLMLFWQDKSFDEIPVFSFFLDSIRLFLSYKSSQFYENDFSQKVKRNPTFQTQIFWYSITFFIVNFPAKVNIASNWVS